MSSSAPSDPILRLELREEQDVVVARQRARQLAANLGFEARDQTRIATAVSELARNAVAYAGSGRVEFSLEHEVPGSAPANLVIVIQDRGPGIADLAAVLDGRKTPGAEGAAMGLLAARRLVDTFEIESNAASGTVVTVRKQFGKRNAPPPRSAIPQLGQELRDQRYTGPLEELREQNLELARTLEELRQRQLELAQVNQELEETNRGVVALYAELDERADYLQRASEIKTRFLSNMTHEFRTPLNSILSLAQILLRRLDGELTSEQEKQVSFIHKSAATLSELVNDLLDLAKVEAGRVDIHPARFDVAELFNVLRGMLRPLLAQNGEVELSFEVPQEMPALHTDESKVSQILRNFISNALKYTERGHVRVSASLGPDEHVVFAVADTGVGIAAADQILIFEEFTQIDSPLQRKVHGTGLGLPLSSKLAALLGGRVEVESELGKGSIFRAILPMHFRGALPPEAT